MSAWSTTSASSRARRGRRATPSARSPDVARLGIVLSAFTPLPAAGLLAVAREAEARGYHTAWVGEVAGYDALTVMALLATHTERLHVGSAVVPVQTRTPVLLGMSAASLNHFAPDRVVLGLGLSSRVIVGDWHGLSFSPALQQLREAVHIIRQVAAGERVSVAGAVPPGENLRPAPPPPRPPPPLLPP